MKSSTHKLSRTPHILIYIALKAVASENAIIVSSLYLEVKINQSKKINYTSHIE